METVRVVGMLFVLNAVHLCVSPAFAQVSEPVLAYFIGNSLTDNMSYRNVEEFASFRGKKYKWYRHMIPGAPLSWIWDHPKDGITENNVWRSVGGYAQALPNNKFTIVTAQPFDQHTFSELGYFNKLFDLALRGNPDVQMYVYQSWPTFSGNISWEDQWLFDDPRAPANYGYRRCEDCFEVIAKEATRAHPAAKPVLIVPGGVALFLLKKRIDAGRIPGLEKLQDVFKDTDHLNDIGRYLVSLVAYATFFREDPRGLPTGEFRLDPSLARVMQGIAWEAVTNYPFSGVTPGAAGNAPSTSSRLFYTSIYWRPDVSARGTDAVSRFLAGTIGRPLLAN